MSTRPLIKESLMILNVFNINPLKSKPLKSLFVAIQLLSLVFLTLETMAQVILNWKSWDSVEAFSLIAGLIQTSSKLLCMVMNDKKLALLIKEMENFWNLVDFDYKYQEKVKLYNFYAKRYIQFFFGTTVGLVTAYYSKPLLLQGRTLPFDTYHPTDLYSPHLYQLMYVFQLYIGITSIILVVAFDSLFISFIVNIFCEIKLIKVRFILLNVESENAKNVNAIVSHHNLVLKCIKDLNEIYSGFLFNQFLNSCICLCFGLLSFVANGFQQIAKYCSYLIAVLTQIFIYCFIGTFLTTETSSVSNAIYGSQWWVKTQPKFRRSCVLVILRSNKIDQLNAVGMFGLNLETFINLLKFVLSFVTLMIQIKGSIDNVFV